MNAYSVSEATSQSIRVSDVENSVDGNYCRCTGYRPIVDALMSLARDAPEDLLRRNGTDIEVKVTASLSRTCKVLPKFWY